VSDILPQHTQSAHSIALAFRRPNMMNWVRIPVFIKLSCRGARAHIREKLQRGLYNGVGCYVGLLVGLYSVLERYLRPSFSDWSERHRQTDRQRSLHIQSAGVQPNSLYSTIEQSWASRKYNGFDIGITRLCSYSRTLKWFRLCNEMTCTIINVIEFWQTVMPLILYLDDI